MSGSYYGMTQSCPAALRQRELSRRRAVCSRVTLLLAAALQSDPSIDALAYLARHAERRECGCAPAKRGDLGRIVVTFLACGYSHLSRDEFAGQKIGDVLLRLLPEIVAAQRDDGLFFPDDPTANAWMAYALTETVDATGEDRWKAPARRAAEAIQGLPASDVDALFWQSLVLCSAGLVRDLPAAPEGDSPLEIARKDHRWVLSRVHVREEHQGWKARAIAPWPALRWKDGCGAGSWERSVEATSYLATVMGRMCWPCRAFGRGE